MCWAAQTAENDREWKVEGTQVKKLGFLVVFIGLLVLVARIFLPFVTVIIWSAIFYAFLYPVFRKLSLRKDGEDRNKFARNLLAAALALGGVLLIAVPGVFLGIAMVKQLSGMLRDGLIAIEKNPATMGLSADGPIASLLSAISGGTIDIGTPVGGLRHFLGSQTNQILGLSGKLLKDFLGIVINLLFMIFTIFFFLIDGRHLAKVLINALPIEKSYTTIFLQKFRDMGRHLVTGYFFVALLQATVMLVLCLIFSIKGGLVIAFLTAIASFIPMVGTALVLIPVAAAKFIAGDITAAVVFLILSITLIWTIDTFIRPLLLQDRLKIHPLLIFFSILGGLTVFKFNGIVLGPLILILFFTALELYKQIYETPPASQHRRKDDLPLDDEERKL
jgi:predicted PurR-regulated permease PerM